MERLIIDTDPGIDDAQAILMAAAHPNARIEAITAVGGNVGLAHTLRNSLLLTEIIEQEIPVYAGCDRPLVIFQEDAAFVHGEDGLGGAGLTPKHKQPESEHASLALVRMANAEPRAFTLVTIGPLTNIAVALKLDPALPHKLKRCIVMGGAVTSRGNTSNVSAEFNIYHDPEAAHVVFQAWEGNERPLELVDWEATLRHGISEEVLNPWLALDTPRAAFFKTIMVQHLQATRAKFGSAMMYGADPLAMAVALEPDCVTESAAHHVSIELTGSHTRGQTTVDWQCLTGKPVNARIVLAIDKQRFFTLMEQGLR